ncbi:MAG: hypothetical protein PGN08_11160 [Sphingomonas taxi]
MEIGLAGPAFVFAAFGVGVWITVRAMLPDDRAGRVERAWHVLRLSLDRRRTDRRDRRRRDPAACRACRLSR